MYAKLKNGVIQYAPKNFNTNNGQLITNFNNNEDLMKRYGFKEVIDVRPAFDAETQYKTIKGYREDESFIYVEYEVINKQEPAPSLEERVSVLENELNMMFSIFTEEVNK